MREMRHDAELDMLASSYPSIRPLTVRFLLLSAKFVALIDGGVAFRIWCSLSSAQTESFHLCGVQERMFCYRPTVHHQNIVKEMISNAFRNNSQL